VAISGTDFSILPRHNSGEGGQVTSTSSPSAMAWARVPTWIKSQLLNMVLPPSGVES
jgi:hypothetical protein